MRAKVQKNSSHRFGHKERNRNLHARNPDPSARSLLCLNDKGIQKFKNPGALESHKILNLAVDPSFLDEPSWFPKTLQTNLALSKKGCSDVFRCLPHFSIHFLYKIIIISFSAIAPRWRPIGSEHRPRCPHIYLSTLEPFLLPRRSRHGDRMKDGWVQK